MKRVTWLRPIVVVPKKNGKIRVCVDYRKLNVVTITDAFPLPLPDTKCIVSCTVSADIIKYTCTQTIRRKQRSSLNGAYSS